MSKHITLPVDGAKMLAHLKSRDLRPYLVSKELGYSKNYISYAVSKGKIGKDFALLLERKYGITPEMYDPDKPFYVANPQQAFQNMNMKLLADYVINEMFSRLNDLEINVTIRRRDNADHDHGN